MTKIINFYAGPGTGKSTCAAGLFYLMKVNQFNVELVTEYAKDMVWSGRTNMFEYQEYIFAKQRHRIERLIGKVDYIITDSPINLGHFYMPKGAPYDQFGTFIDACFNEYDNLNILLTRSHAYDPIGRCQTEAEAIQIDKDILNFLNQKNIEYVSIPANEDTPVTLLQLIHELEIDNVNE